MKLKLCIALLLSFSSVVPASAQQPTKKMTDNVSYFEQHPFLWGAASASYQVEGAYTSDGKGLSNWDIWMNKYEIGGKGVTGNVAINFYDREQYLQDIKLFKKLGLTSYRFSISWPRIIPGGTGKVNQEAISHYRTFIKDLRIAGIEPVMTLYHWDMPNSLYEKGGWNNRESIEWYSDFAKVVFENFKDLVKIYVLSNEMLIETDMTFQAEDIIKQGKGEFSIIPSPQKLGAALDQFNHKLLAVSAAAKVFHSYRISEGEVGVAFPLFPTIAVDTESSKAAELIDGIVNRWFLDAIYKGTYPTDVIAYAKAHHLELKIQEGDALQIKNANLSYLGINYYSPLIIKKEKSSPFYGVSFPTLPDTEYAFNGANRPDQLERLLLRVKDEYGNPPVIITENGASFPGDDILKNGTVNDQRRSLYLKGHINAMQSARTKGCRVFGYHVWSSHDNLEWIAGYGRRFGMIYVDFKTQQRILKNSAIEYGKYVKSEVNLRNKR